VWLINLEHQRVVKDLKRNNAETNYLWEYREKLEQDL